MKLIDLSHKIEDNMPVYPGDTRVCLSYEKTLDKNGYNAHRLEISMHAGTHIDSPMHLTNSKKYISEIPAEVFISKGCLLDVRNEAAIQMKPEYEDLVKENRILLLYSGWDIHYGTKIYYESHPCLCVEFCEFIISRHIKMLGFDMPSPDRFPFKMHELLLDNNIYILENLTNLDQLLKVPEFEIIALPLKIKADSSMTRAVARVLQV